MKIDLKALIKKMLIPETSNLEDASGYICLFGLLLCWSYNTQAVSSSAAATWTTTFQKAFKYKPVVFTQIIENNSPQLFHVSVTNITTSGCTWRRISSSSTSYNCTINWIAIGISA